MHVFHCPSNSELIGYYVLALVENIQSPEVRPIMEKHGLVNLVPDQWYPLRLWFDAFNEMLQLPNVMDNMVAIGMKIGQLIPIPPGLQNPTYEQMLMAWDGIYQQAHRNGDVGHILCEKVGDKHYKAILTDSYPDDLTYGIFYTLTRRFLPPGTQFKLYYDQVFPARDRGGKDVTLIHVEWQ